MPSTRKDTVFGFPFVSSNATAWTDPPVHDSPPSGERSVIAVTASVKKEYVVWQPRNAFPGSLTSLAAQLKPQRYLVPGSRLSGWLTSIVGSGQTKDAMGVFGVMEKAPCVACWFIASENEATRAEVRGTFLAPSVGFVETTKGAVESIVKLPLASHAPWYPHTRTRAVVVS